MSRCIYNLISQLLGRTDAVIYHRVTPGAFSILDVYGRFPTIGLAENMVYDVIPIIPNAVGSTAVNASIYNVTCSTLPAGDLSAHAVNNTGTYPTTATIAVSYLPLNDSEGAHAYAPLPCRLPIF